MKRVVTGFFTNAETGRLVIAQWPNPPLALFLAAAAVRRLFALEGTIGTVTSIIATLALLVWAGLEIALGDSPFRRVLGTAVFLVTVVGIVTR